MNQIQIRRISNIGTTKKLVERVVEKKRKIKFKEFELLLMDTFTVSLRTAKEYIKISLFQMKLDRKDLSYGNIKKT